jgi:hypothetical protein
VNAHFPVPSFGFDCRAGLPDVPEVSNKLDAFLEAPGQIHTNAFVPPVQNGNKHHNTPPSLPPVNRHPRVADDVQFHVKTKTVFICAYRNCNKEFGRKPELYRHHLSAHKAERPYKCRDNSCSRSIHGFPRTDKRDDHERKVHGVRRSRGSGINAM